MNMNPADIKRAMVAREREGIASFVRAVADDDARAMGKALVEVGNSCVWGRARALVRRGVGGSVQVRRAFLDIHARSGDHIRQEVDDDLLLADAYRFLLPLYQGPGMTLFRGDTFFNRRRRTYGLCWSDDIEVARSHAEEGHSRVAEGGSVLLTVEAGAEAIICAPALHEHCFEEEREFIVDCRRLRGVRVIARYEQKPFYPAGP